MSINDDKANRSHEYKYEIARCSLFQNDNGCIVITCVDTKNEINTTIDHICNTMLAEFPKQQQGMLLKLRSILVG